MVRRIYLKLSNPGYPKIALNPKSPSIKSQIFAGREMTRRRREINIQTKVARC
jgi:hypothetical protein